MSATDLLRVQDKLNLTDNKNFQKCLEKFRKNKKNREHFFDADPTEVTERVRYSDILIKINRKGKRQKRALVVTNLAVYNFKPGSYKSFQRRINTAHLDKIICLAGVNEFVLCMWEYSFDYDYRFDAEDPVRCVSVACTLSTRRYLTVPPTPRVPWTSCAQTKRDEIIGVLQDSFELLLGNPLPVVRDFDEKLMATVMKTKKDARARSSSAGSAAETQKVRRHSQVRVRLRKHSITQAAHMGSLLSPSVLDETINEGEEDDEDHGRLRAGAGGAGAGGTIMEGDEDEADDDMQAGLTSVPFPSTGGAVAAGIDLSPAGAAAGLVDVIYAVKMRCGADNPVLEQLCDAEIASLVDAVKLWAEVVGTKEACDPMVTLLGQEQAWGTLALDTNRLVLNMQWYVAVVRALATMWAPLMLWVRVVQQSGGAATPRSWMGNRSVLASGAGVRAPQLAPGCHQEVPWLRASHRARCCQAW